MQSAHVIRVWLGSPSARGARTPGRPDQDRPGPAAGPSIREQARPPWVAIADWTAAGSPPAPSIRSPA
jgi:hypothetical protein